MVWATILGVLGLIFWILTIFTLRGVDWVLISGVTTLSKGERQKFKEKNNMTEMNRYIGKRVFLPIALMLSIIAPLMLNANWMQSTWFGIVIFIVVIVVLVSIFSAIPKILGTTFESDTTIN